jgi:lysophospholipase L1-like esterase
MLVTANDDEETALQRLLHVRLVCCAIMASLTVSCGDGSGASSSPNVAIVGGPPFVSPSPIPTAMPSMGTSASNEIPAGVIVQAGDSIGFGLAADWAAIDHLGFPASVMVHNVSVSGIGMADGYNQRAAQLFPFRSYTSPSVLIIQQGTNDLHGGRSAKSLYGSILTKFISSAHAAGFYVVVDTILPRTDDGWAQSMENERVAYNLLVRGNSAKADGINDIASDSLIGDGSNPTTSVYYADRIHLTLAGQQRFAILDAAALKEFMLLPVHSISR